MEKFELKFVFLRGSSNFALTKAVQVDLKYAANCFEMQQMDREYIQRTTENKNCNELTFSRLPRNMQTLKDKLG